MSDKMTPDFTQFPSHYEFEHELRSIANDKSIPLRGSFELTPLCNFRCKMCYVRLDPHQMSKIGTLRSAREWIDMGRQIADAGTLYLLLTGGEVFARPDFREIYEALTEMGLVLTIYSNGALIDEKALEWFAKRPPSMLRITLYGASNDTYDKVCGDPKGFDKVMRNIDLIKEAGINLSLVGTFIQENQGDLDNLREYAKEKNIRFTSTKSIVSEVRGAEAEAKESRIDGEGLNIKPLELKDRVKAMFPIDESSAFAKCGSKGCTYWITWDGKMVFCGMMDKPEVYPFRDGFKNSYEDLLRQLSLIKYPEECKGCKYAGFCNGCPSVFNAETGSPEKPSEYICSVAKARYYAFSIDGYHELNSK